MHIKGKKTTTSFLEWNEFISLITRLERDGDYKFALLISIGTLTGLRISDLLKLRYSDLTAGDALIITEKKTKKERRIMVSPTLREIFNRLVIKREVQDFNELIFLNRFGTKAIDKCYVNSKLKKIYKKYKIKSSGNISTHTFRKTFGRKVMEAHNYSGESMVLLMEVFGHSNQAITKRYLGIRQEEIDNIYNSLTI